MSTCRSIRARWAAIGAAVAVTLGAGGLGIVEATTSSGVKSIYQPIEPCRLADTRPASAVGPRTVGVGPNETYTLDGWGTVGGCVLPSGTTGLALNVTAVGPTARTFLKIFPAGSALPATSNLNPEPGQPPAPNAVNVGLDSSGRFSVFNNAGVVNVLIDVVGVYDDHTHDDRYYTKAEVDSRVAVASGVAAQSGGDQSETMGLTDTVYRSVSILAPAAGTVVASASGTITSLSTGANDLRCSISTNGQVDDSATLIAFIEGFGRAEVIAATRGFDVAIGQVFVANLVCETLDGGGRMNNSSLTAVFVPD